MSLIAQLAVLGTLTALEALEPTHEVLRDLSVEPAGTPYIQARLPETVIRGRPWVPHKRLATVTRGTRLIVRGKVPSRDERGCNSHPWYVVVPFGFVCSEHAEPTDKPPTKLLALTPEEGRRLPFTYATVRQDDIPMYVSPEQIESGIPERPLSKGMSLAVRRTLNIVGQRYIETLDGQLVPRDGTGFMGEGSSWQGVRLRDFTPGPAFAWVVRSGVSVHTGPSREHPRVDKLARRERVALVGHDGQPRKHRWWQIADDRWVDGQHLNEVVVTMPPQGVISEYRMQLRGDDQWIDVDLGEQVLVAYRGSRPVYATLVSTGRSFPTPRGNYPIWAKVASMTMANQGYEDQPYMVQGVPWVLLFQGHNAIHGAYWHDRFGTRKSHGCVNVSPTDARWLFEWVAPIMPTGWTGYLPSDLARSTVVHVRDSSRAPAQQFTQDRPVGPPDREEEQKKLEEAEIRRELLALEMARQAALEEEEMGTDTDGGGPSPSTTGPQPGVEDGPGPR